MNRGSALQLARASRASRIGTRAGRVVRVIRLVRLFKLFKKKTEIQANKAKAKEHPEKERKRRESLALGLLNHQQKPLNKVKEFPKRPEESGPDRSQESLLRNIDEEVALSTNQAMNTLNSEEKRYKMLSPSSVGALDHKRESLASSSSVFPLGFWEGMEFF